MDQETDKVCRENMFDPCWRKTILLFRLEIATKLSKDRQA